MRAKGCSISRKIQKPCKSGQESRLGQVKKFVQGMKFRKIKKVRFEDQVLDFRLGVRVGEDAMDK